MEQLDQSRAVRWIPVRKKCDYLSSGCRKVAFNDFNLQSSGVVVARYYYCWMRETWYGIDINVY